MSDTRLRQVVRDFDSGRRGLDKGVRDALLALDPDRLTYPQWRSRVINGERIESPFGEAGPYLPRYRMRPPVEFEGPVQHPFMRWEILVGEEPAAIYCPAGSLLGVLPAGARARASCAYGEWELLREGRAVNVEFCGRPRIPFSCMLQPGHEPPCEGPQGPRVVARRNAAFARLGRRLAEDRERRLIDVLVNGLPSEDPPGS